MKRFLLRIPDKLHAQIKTAAGQERRSVHNEIVSLLERSLAAETRQPGAIVAQDALGPGRAALVITELADLRGPAGGKIVLPTALYRDPTGQIFDLDEPWLLGQAYQVVLTQASGARDLATWLNAPRLIETWPQLHLPTAVRQAWEQVHPILTERTQT